MKTIHISLSPNLESDDLKLSISKLINPFIWKKTNYQNKLIQSLNQIFPTSQAFLFNSGRSGLQLALQSLNLPKKSEIITQAFTCSAVINPILANQLKPVYADIKLNSFNLNHLQLNKLLTPKTKAIIIQHTFGTPANLRAIRSFVQKHNLLLIEDCAHSLGAHYQNKPLGSFGDITLLSFGRDKIISSVFGGAILINNPHLLPSFKKLYSKLKLPNHLWTTQQLLHPPLSYLAKKTYHLQIGKLILLLSQKLKLISRAIYPQEKIHQTPTVFPAKLPNPLAHLALNQLNKLSTFNLHRQKIALIYQKKIINPKLKKPQLSKNSIYLRYNILLSNPQNLFTYLKKNQIIAGDWYSQPITPSNNLKLTLYTKGSCPNAEKACQQNLNLPTHPTLSIKQVTKIIYLLNKFK
ncbi:DegT/DnrJ/EryC1/StrS family aminotransferase [Patescibacteria group bacterium]|nr:DegT/DnrJ/EryC1/StrS family aminotransferase [Patescibacteria group bacterium]